MIERVAGAAPETCPWQAYGDPFVGEVLDLWRIASTGDGVSIASVWQMDPADVLWEGLQHYAHSVAKVREQHRHAADQLRGR